MVSLRPARGIPGAGGIASLLEAVKNQSKPSATAISNYSTLFHLNSVSLHSDKTVGISAPITLGVPAVLTLRSVES